MPEPMNLDNPAPPVVAAVETPPVMEIQPDPDEASAVEVPGAGKHVPLPALQAVRAENKTLRDKAGRVDQLEALVQQLKPYADFVQANPQLTQRPQPQQPTQTEGDPDLIELARSLDFYRTDGSGKPDLDRAAKHQALINRQAQRVAEQIVGPLALNTYNDQAGRNWQQAVQEKLPNGQAINHELLATAWREVYKENPAMLADPRVVRIIVNNVVAEQMRASPLGYAQPTAPGRAPVVTEHVGARPGPGSNRMNDTQRAIVAGRNIDDTKFNELTKGFTPGRMNVLED